MDFAKELKRMRQNHKLSLQQLANKTGVSKSMLSKIERKEKNPTLQIAAQIAEGLGVSLSSMLEERSYERVVVIKASEQVIFRDETTGFERRLLSPTFPVKGIEFIHNTIPENSPGIKFLPHLPGVREFVSVTKGKLKIKLNQNSFMLEEGDSIFFEANTQHNFYSEGSSECCYYLIIDSHEAKSA